VGNNKAQAADAKAVMKALRLGPVNASLFSTAAADCGQVGGACVWEGGCVEVQDLLTGHDVFEGMQGATLLMRDTAAFRHTSFYPNIPTAGSSYMIIYEEFSSSAMMTHSCFVDPHTPGLCRPLLDPVVRQTVHYAGQR
jgi:hypothetical protein